MRAFYFLEEYQIDLKPIANLGNYRLNLHLTPAILQQRLWPLITIITAKVSTAAVD